MSIQPYETHGGYVPLQPLDIYAQGLTEEEPRIDALATISFGRLIGDGPNARPAASKMSDAQWIHIHDIADRAPGLTAALQAGNGRRLTIAFPDDNPARFITQRFAERTKTALKAYGDENEIIEIVMRGDSATHVPHKAGTDKYAEIVARCKAEISVFFALAEWADEGPRVIFPDGLGLYRLRFTSRNSLRNIIATLTQTARMTGNRIAGIPFDLGVDFREVADPKGQKRTIPVATLVMRPPTVLSSLTFRNLAQSALDQGEALRMLPAPVAETLEMALVDDPPLDVSDDDIALLERGGRCDKAHWLRTWHATVKDTYLATSDGRRNFIADYTDGIGSLATFLESATEEEAARLIEAARAAIQFDDFDDDEYDRVYGADDAEQEQAVAPLPDPVSKERAGYIAGYAALYKMAHDRKITDGVGQPMPAYYEGWTDADLISIGQAWKKLVEADKRLDAAASVI